MLDLRTLVGFHCAIFCFAVAQPNLAIAQALQPSDVEAPIVSQWLSAADGDWTGSSNWSTNPTFPNNGLPAASDNYEVLIDAIGSRYRVTLQDDVAVDRITIDAPGAILHHRQQRLEVDNILLEQGVFEIGGTLVGTTISGPGTVRDATVFTTGRPRFENVTLGTQLQQTFSITDIIGDLTLDNGRWDQIGGTLSFEDDAPQSILGTGSIDLDGAIQITNQLTVDTGVTINVREPDGFTSTSNGSIRGDRLVNEGVLSSDGGGLRIQVDSLQNNGTIDVSGQTILGTDADTTWRNDGTIQLQNTGTLHLGGTFRTEDIGTVVDDGGQAFISGVLDNRGQTLRLGELGFANQVLLNGGAIRGGVLEGQNDFLEAVNSSFLDGLTIAGQLTVGESRSNPILIVQNDLMLDDAVVTINEGTSLLFTGSGTQLLGGNGTIRAVNRDSTSSINSIAGRGLTIGEGITIRTGNEAYRELEVAFVENRGTIISEAPDTLVTIGDSVRISPAETWVNNGTIQVLDGTLELKGNYSFQAIGDLDFQGGTVRLGGTIDNEGRTFRQDASTGVWEFRGSLNGGRLETGDGVVADVGGQFQNVTLAGDAEIAARASITNVGRLNLFDTLSFDDGSLRIGNFNELRLLGNNVLAGQGEVLLDGTPATARIQTFTGTQLLIEQGITIRTGDNGGGTISRGQLPVINRGTISARTSGQTLVVDGSLENTGVLEATSGSILRIEVDDWQNDGTIQTMGGTIQINGNSFVNGEEGVIAGIGEIDLETAVLVNQGTLDPTALKISGSLSLQETSVLGIDVNGFDSFDTIQLNGELSLGGQLNVNLADQILLAGGQQLVFIEAFGSVTGQFEGLGEGDLVSSSEVHDLRITYQGGDGNDVALFIAVPEPSSLPLVFCILVPMFRRSRLR